MKGGQKVGGQGKGIGLRETWEEANMVHNSQRINLKQKPSSGQTMAPCLGALAAVSEVRGSHSPI